MTRSPRILRSAVVLLVALLNACSGGSSSADPPGPADMNEARSDLRNNVESAERRIRHRVTSAHLADILARIDVILDAPRD
jgi:hypothetical protein